MRIILLQIDLAAVHPVAVTVVKSRGAFATGLDMNTAVDTILCTVIRAFMGRITGFQAQAARTNAGGFAGRTAAAAMRSRSLCIGFTAIRQFAVTICITGFTR